MLAQSAAADVNLEEEEEEEDLSMVSDASSGPPHFQEEDEHCFYYLHSSTCFGGNGCLCSALVPTAELAMSGGKKRRVEPKQQGKHSSLLDDTASSPPFSSSKTSSFSGDDNRSRGSHMMPPIASVLEFSCGFSATHFKRNHAVEKQMGGYLQSSAPVKPTPSIPGTKERRREDHLLARRRNKKDKCLKISEKSCLVFCCTSLICYYPFCHVIAVGSNQPEQ
nr:PREDICTED: uncharacterized protein LOC103980826 isoform X1 [Musa acuminata subsp. malaccensis]